MIPVIHTHARRSICRSQTYGQVTVPSDLHMGLYLSPLEGIIPNHMLRDLASCYGTLCKGVYQISYKDISFIKVRGHLRVNGIILPIEIVYAKAADEWLPIIVRISREPSSPVYEEYLVFVNVVILRHKLFGTPISVSSMFHDIVGVLANIGRDDITIYQSSVLDGCSSTSVTLTPSTNNVIRAIDTLSAAYSGHRIENRSAMDMIISETFFTGANVMNVLQLGGIIDGKIPYRSVDNFRPITEILNHLDYTTNSTIDSIEFFETLKAFSNLIFDEYEIWVSLSGYDLEIDIGNMTSTSGVYTNYSNVDSIREYLYELVHDLIINFSANGGRIYKVNNDYFFESKLPNDKFIFTIEALGIIKTPDEELRIQFYANDDLLSFDYDLLFLSILSPTVSM